MKDIKKFERFFKEMGVEHHDMLNRADCVSFLMPEKKMHEHGLYEVKHVISVHECAFLFTEDGTYKGVCSTETCGYHPRLTDL